MDAAATLIYLLRHGEPALADTRRFLGHLDVPLSERGEAQCAAQAERLRGARLSAVFSSDLARARRSGEIIGAPHGLVPTTLAALREMDMGRWDGLSAAEVEAREPGVLASFATLVGDYPFPGGENVPQLVARVWPAFETIVAEHSGQSVAIVAHAGSIRAILCRALELPLTRLLAFGQEYAALNVLERVDGGWRLRRLTETPML
jgi:alpha-ribazole phosphatase